MSREILLDGMGIYALGEDARTKFHNMIKTMD